MPRHSFYRDVILVGLFMMSLVNSVWAHCDFNHDGFDDLAMMLGYGLRDDLVMHRQQSQHAGFISTHLAAEADNVGEHDSSQPASFSRCRTARLFPHGGDYAAPAYTLSNAQEKKELASTFCVLV